MENRVFQGRVDRFPRLTQRFYSQLNWKMRKGEGKGKHGSPLIIEPFELTRDRYPLAA